MRISVILLMVVMVFVGCENPGELNQEDNIYQGQRVQTGPAPFLVQANSLAKTADGTILIEETTSDGTVYGLLDESTVYAADGGEALPKGTWIDNQDSEPIEVSLSSDVVITFEQYTSVTILDATNITYIDESGQVVPFSGSGIITTIEISTGSDGSVTLISTIKFAIGGEGGDTG